MSVVVYQCLENIQHRHKYKKKDFDYEESGACKLPKPSSDSDISKTCKVQEPSHDVSLEGEESTTERIRQQGILDDMSVGDKTVYDPAEEFNLLNVCNKKVSGKHDGRDDGVLQPKKNKGTNFVQENILNVSSGIALSKKMQDYNREQISLNIPYLEHKTKFSRRELHSYYVTYKALCEVTANRIGMKKYSNYPNFCGKLKIQIVRMVLIIFHSRMGLRKFFCTVMKCRKKFLTRLIITKVGL